MAKLRPHKSMEVPSHNGHESDTCVEESKEHTDLNNSSITSCDSQIKTTQSSQSSSTSEL